MTGSVDDVLNKVRLTGDRFMGNGQQIPTVLLGKQVLNIVGLPTQTLVVAQLPLNLPPGREDPSRTVKGNVGLDANGEAVVYLPPSFRALHSDFQYQLTTIGGPAPSLYIAEEVQNGKFKIAGGRPGSKVSWQVTAADVDDAVVAER
jgi:hypothetical protein